MAVRIRDDVPTWFLDAMSMPREQIQALRDKDIPRNPGWREGPNLDLQSDWHWAEERFSSEPMDPGIICAVRIFQEHGIETCQSCQGGEGHSYEWPTVDIYRAPWKALDIANDFALPVTRISEQFGIADGRPVEHFWRIEFSPARLATVRGARYHSEARDREEFLAWQAAHPETGK
jgi:hypothetical protein